MNFKSLFQKIKNQLAARQIQEFELYFLREKNNEVEVKDQSVESFDSAESVGVSLRVLKNKRIGFSYTTDFSDESIQKMIERAEATSTLSDANDFFSFSASSVSPLTWKDFDEKSAQLSPQIQTQMALELEKAALAYDSRVRKVRGASCSNNVSEVFLANSAGVFLNHSQTQNGISLMAVAEEGEEAESSYEFAFSNFFQNLNPEQVGSLGAKKALRYLGGVAGKNYRGPVLLDSLLAAEILEVLVSSFCGDALAKQRSLLEGKWGQKIFSDQLTLIDDGLLREGYASFPFDGEGQPKQKTILLEKGVFQNALFDQEYAKRLKKPATGSASREGIRRPPHIACSNCYWVPGKLSFEELTRKIGEGVYITDLVGLHTANPISGDFSVGAQGFEIRGGEITRPLKQIAVSGNLKEVMARVKEVGADLRFAFKMGSPSLLIEEMHISGG